MEQFRENEVKKIREEERQKCQMELQSLRKEVCRIDRIFSSIFVFFLFSVGIVTQIEIGNVKRKRIENWRTFQSGIRSSFDVPFSSIDFRCFQNERRELFSQRQTFLEELKTMKLRETEMQRNLELRERFDDKFCKRKLRVFFLFSEV